MRNHQADARRDIGFLEVGSNAFPELIRLADIQHLALAVEKTIHARQQRQAVEYGFWVKFPVTQNVSAQGSLYKSVIPAQAGIQQEQKFRKADKTTFLSHFAGDALIAGFTPARE